MVTKFTEPSMIVAMSKVSAIITDYGGITSHAAIVSKEFGIPCIVGTEKATEKLKDGMIIKIDADNGVIFF